jgi:hypothetical protein
MKIFWKYLFWLLALFILAVLSLSWQSAAPGYLNLLSLPLLAILIFSWLKRDKNLMWPAFFLGVFLDFMSFGFFGWQMVIWPLLVLILHFLSLNFFSSRSAYSFLLLSIILTISYYLLLSLAAYFVFVQNYFPLFQGWYLRNMALESIFNFLALFIFFLFFRRRRQHFDLV